jgi:hypothetical protein
MQLSHLIEHPGARCASLLYHTAEDATSNAWQQQQHSRLSLASAAMLMTS